MSRVFPGAPDVLAKSFLCMSILIKLDFPTFDRPINANSGNVVSGHSLTFEELFSNAAVCINIRQRNRIYL